MPTGHLFELTNALSSSDVVSISTIGEYYCSFCRLSLSLEKRSGRCFAWPLFSVRVSPPELRHGALERHKSPGRNFTIPSLIAAAKEVLVFRGSLWRATVRARAALCASGSHFPRRSLFLNTSNLGCSYSVCFPPGLEFVAERQPTAHLSPVCAVHNTSHPRIQ
ncbi:hypothetical protein M404DRAFT_608055 [Pisolithus tinctorius Marx 270]|uniref:Uncharacterized protein n=1 Tax=Pisolithus tinctorius Marx 270 TaxID=870435 RepID=A0A0C3P8P8_PISTI|nr:hypothetical protein M404DRAFT_608055 [Pisolithus tinctorius Marx 270]